MKNWTIIRDMLTIILLGCMAVLTAGVGGEKGKVTENTTAEQVVLYTLYRGPYQEVGPAFGKLFAVAGQNGMIPAGPTEMAYLNNPGIHGLPHALSELRIPVQAAALEKAGTLGPFTDVKKIPALKVVAVGKPAGVPDPHARLLALENYLKDKKLAAQEGPFEVFLQGVETGDYSQMVTEVMIPYELSK